MQAEFWKQRWEEGQIGFHQAETNPHLLAHWETTGVSGGNILVPLCGKSLDMLWLMSHGHKVTGVELSEIAVRDFLSENSLQASESQQGELARYSIDGLDLYQGDFFAYQPAGEINAVFDRASLIALPPEMREQYAQHLTQMLNSGTPVLLVTMEYDQQEMSGPPFCVTDEEVHKLYDASFTIEMLEEIDILAEQPQFKERGLSRLCERVYRMVRK